MEFCRKQIKANARAALSAHYWPVVGNLFLGVILASVISGVATWYNFANAFFMTGNLVDAMNYDSNISMVSNIITLVGSIVAIMFSTGISIFAYHVYRGEEPKTEDLFSGFKFFLHVLGGNLYMGLLIFLWTLLFVIPGIVKAYSYSMTPYILVDKPEVSATGAVSLSKRMTNGYKADLFVLDLSFIGWEILAVCTLGILDIFYVTPYATLAKAGAYDFLKFANGMTPANNGVPVNETNLEEKMVEQTDSNIFDE